MVACGQLALGLGQVERATVGLGVAGDEEHEEGHAGWHMSLDDEPVPRSGLCLDDAAHLHRAEEDHGRDVAEAQ